MSILKKGIYFLLSISLLLGCKDDDELSSLGSISELTFDLTAADDKGREVTVTPRAKAATLYTVDFGNAADSKDVFITSGPSVSYTYPDKTATYTIKVTASAKNAASVTFEKQHTVNGTVVPPTPSSPIAGTWKLAPEAGALGVGPAKEDISWWSNTTADVTTRACLFDDEYVFNADGTFANNLGTDTWLEPWQGVTAESCGTPVFPHDGTATASYVYDATAGTIKITGKGAFLGLAKATNSGQLTAPGGAPDDVTYLAELSADGNTLNLDIDYGAGFWSFKLVKQGTTTPPVSSVAGTWKLAPEAGALGVGPAKEDVSWWSNNTADVTTRACLFDDEYVFNSDGSFSNNLGTDTWLEPWQGVTAESCGTPVFPHDGTATASYVYDATAGTIKITGKGAFLGLAKATNSGQLTAPGGAPDDVTYLAELSADGNTLNLDIDYGAGFWSFKLVKNGVSPPPPSTGSDPHDDFEGNGNITTWFADAVVMDKAFANPSKTGINTSNTVLKYSDEGGQYANIRFDLSTDTSVKFDLSTKNKFKVKVFVPTPTSAHTQPKQLALKLQDGSSGTPWVGQAEVIQPYVYDQWQELTFDFSAQSAATNFSRIVIQFNGENNSEHVVGYIDDILYE